jgi:hypothetical protein
MNCRQGRGSGEGNVCHRGRLYGHSCVFCHRHDYRAGLGNTQTISCWDAEQAAVGCKRCLELGTRRAATARSAAHGKDRAPLPASLVTVTSQSIMRAITRRPMPRPRGATAGPASALPSRASRGRCERLAAPEHDAVRSDRGRAMADDLPHASGFHSQEWKAHTRGLAPGLAPRVRSFRQRSEARGVSARPEGAARPCHRETC